MFEPVLDPRNPTWVWRLALALIGVALIALIAWIWRMTQMPFQSYKGPLQPLSAEESQLATRVADHVNFLSKTIGERSLSRPGSLQAAADYIRDTLRQAGYSVSERTYSAGSNDAGNVEASLIGADTGNEIVVVGAHYDSVAGTVGADDNSTGVAATLELARLLQGSKLRRTVRFVFFVNEEPPYFQTDAMGSLVYARRLKREHASVTAMISLEMLGFYSDVPGSQKYPPFLRLFYPSRGDFIAFVGNSESRDLLGRSIRTFREDTRFPSEGLAAPSSWPGVGWSDHWSFWQEHYPAIMITDTAMFRNPYYHTRLDTADRIDFARMARVVDGVRKVVKSLATEQ